MKKTFLILTLFFYTISNGQINLPNILPSNPEAANFEKYENIPVGLFTGIPQITIPIHNINLKELSIPINLSYHSSGIKVDEVASKVGLGWVLNAGGLVSCNTRGNPDFDVYGYAYSGNGSQLLYDRYRVGAFEEETINENSLFPNDDRDILDMIASGQIDGEPDLFHYNFLSNSGKFVYDETITPRTIPFKAIKIERLDGGAAYQITDELGNIFTFSDLESSLIRPAIGSDCDVINPIYSSVPLTPTWYLSEIKTPYNEIVTFNYETISYSYEYIASQQDFIREYNLEFGFGLLGCEELPFKECKNIVDVIVGKRLTSINTSYGTEVVFSYETAERLDLPGTNALKQIQLFNEGTSIDSWDLDYDYFQSVLGSTNDENYRLKLMSLTRTGVPPYKFFYDETESLPKRNSFSQDHWGYGNGKLNSTFLPETPYRSTIIPGANREPDFEYTKAGILNRIVYPTGGETLFEHEPNEFWFDGVESVLTSYTSPVLTVNGQATTSPLTAQFTLTEDVYAVLKFTCTGNLCDDLSSVPPGDFMSATLTGNNYYNNLSYPNSYLPSNPLIVSGEMPIELEAGTYTMSLFASVDGFSGTFSIDWSESEEVLFQENRVGGGLRIKSITNKPIVGNEIIKTFSYVNPTTPSKSSGFTSFTPQYTYQMYNRNFEIVGPNIDDLRENFCNYFSRGSQNLSNVSSINGGDVGYEYVTEINGDNGKSITKFSDFKDVGFTNVTIWPFVPPTSYDWIRGLKLEQTDFKKDENTFSKSKETVYNYDIKQGINGVFENEANENNILGLTVTTIRPYFISGSIPRYSILDIGVYWTTASWYTLESKEDRLYNSNDDSFTSTFTTFSYDNPLHGLQTRSETVNSEEELHVTEIDYVHDLLGEPFMQDLIDANRIAKPIQTKSFLNNDLLSIQKIKHQEFGINNLLLPSIIQTAKGTSSLEDRITYHDYDDKGNPLEVSKKDGVHVVYIWGYNKKFPIAKIENATYSEVSGQVSNLQTKSDADDDRTFGTAGNEGALRSALTAFRNTAILSDAQVTTYTYDPLIGVTSITDPKGQIIYYEYDDFNRLETVKDQDGKVLSKNEYHYKAQ